MKYDLVDITIYIITLLLSQQKRWNENKDFLRILSIIVFNIKWAKKGTSEFELFNAPGLINVKNNNR
jgi:hypothetical protein